MASGSDGGIPTSSRQIARLSRHEKQAVRRWLRAEGRRVGRAYRGLGTAVGMRELVQRANRQMRNGRAARILYPQDVGCGSRDAGQILREAR